MPRVTVKEFAVHRKVTERSVRQYLSDGLIPKAAITRAGRRIEIDQGKADKFLDKRITTRKELLGKDSPTIPTKQEVTKQAGTAGLSFTEARTLSQRYRAALLKVQLDQTTGRLVDAEQVKATAFAKARAVRDALLNIPDRIAPILAAEGDAARVTEIITREIRQALEGLSK